MIGGKRKLSYFNNPEYDNAEKRDIDFEYPHLMKNVRFMNRFK